MSELVPIYNLFFIDERWMSTKYSYLVIDFKTKKQSKRRKIKIKDYTKEKTISLRYYEILFNALFSNIASVIRFKIITEYLIGPTPVEIIYETNISSVRGPTFPLIIKNWKCLQRQQAFMQLTLIPLYRCRDLDQMYDPERVIDISTLCDFCEEVLSQESKRKDIGTLKELFHCSICKQYSSKNYYTSL